MNLAAIIRRASDARILRAVASGDLPSLTVSERRTLSRLIHAELARRGEPCEGDHHGHVRGVEE